MTDSVGLAHSFTDAQLREWASITNGPARNTIDHDLDLTICELSRALLAAREKNAALNRRCQSAESGLTVKLDEVKRQGGSFGRALAFAGYVKAEAENAELRSALAEAKTEIERLEEKRSEIGEAYMIAADACNQNIEEGIRLRDEVAAQAERIAALEGEIERLKVAEGEAMLVVESTEHKLGIAYAALKPFADVARRLGPEHADENEAPIAWSRTGPNISIGDLRRAALASPSEPAGGRKGE